MSYSIVTADLDWQLVDGIEVPVSKQFGDVYFSKDNGLLETRHVFLNGNDLSQRLAQLQAYGYFCVGETGFGTGLNILALWQLWQQVRPINNSHLHAISVEKFPLTKNDLERALKAWPELAPLAEQLIAQYPLPIAGCHRLNFPNERFSLDLWLGDAHDVFPVIPKTHQVHAWFLDGFAPSCNPDMWEDKVLSHLVRLSDVGTTFASFSVAGVLKRGLKQHGIEISRPRGFKHKREMLKGIWPATENIEKPLATSRRIAVVGAGIAGLSIAWAFAQRGHAVTIFEANTALSGASGNPLALLNPKLCPIEQAHEHLMTLAWQHAMRHYAKFKAYRPIAVNQIALKNPEQLLDLAQEYPEQVLSTQTQDRFTDLASLSLHQAAAITPHLLCDEILAHPQIELQHAHITQITNDARPIVYANQACLGEFDHVIVCSALKSAALIDNYPVLKPIRGQVSWLNNAEHTLALDQAYSYGGYCMQLDAEQLILGASFYPQREDNEVLAEDHVHNLNLLKSVAPTYAESLIGVEHWQGRASVRAQSLDYFPLLGKVQDQQQIYTLAGLGSKGFLFAPLCSEILVAEILKQACPVPETLRQKLQVTRFYKKVKAKKPYFKPA